MAFSKNTKSKIVFIIVAGLLFAGGMYLLGVYNDKAFNLNTFVFNFLIFSALLAIKEMYISNKKKRNNSNKEK